MWQINLLLLTVQNQQLPTTSKTETIPGQKLVHAFTWLSLFIHKSGGPADDTEYRICSRNLLQKSNVRKYIFLFFVSRISSKAFLTTLASFLSRVVIF